MDRTSFLVDDLDTGLLLRLVTGENRIRGRLAFQKVKALAAQDHGAERVTIDQKGVLVINPGNDFGGQNRRWYCVVHARTERIEDGLRAGLNFRGGFRMNL